MTPGSKRLSCYGIPGDGCGGGREFVVENGELYALDPVTGEKTILLQNIEDAQAISKRRCEITLTCANGLIIFDLSTLSLKERTASKISE